MSPPPSAASHNVSQKQHRCETPHYSNQHGVGVPQRSFPVERCGTPHWLAWALAFGAALVLGGAPDRPVRRRRRRRRCSRSGTSPRARRTATRRRRRSSPRVPGTIAVLGDIAYESGSRDDFATCFDPSWGALVPRIKAALGNHEYNTGTAAVAIDRFRLPRNGWYSYALGTWHVIVLNSNCSKIGGCERGSPQWRWLRTDLAAHPATLHARLLAPPPLQLGHPRLRCRVRAVLGSSRPRAGGCRPRGARPRLRAFRAGPGHPIVRRGYRWEEPLSDSAAATGQRGAQQHDLRRPQADAPGRRLRLALHAGARRNLHRRGLGAVPVNPSGVSRNVPLEMIVAGHPTPY